MLMSFWNTDDTCDARFALVIAGRARSSTAQGGHIQPVHSVMTEVRQCMIATGGWIVNPSVAYSEAETHVLAFGGVPGQEQLSIRSVPAFTLKVYHGTCICGIPKKKCFPLILIHSKCDLLFNFAIKDRKKNYLYTWRSVWALLVSHPRSLLWHWSYTLFLGPSQSWCS